MLKRVQKQVDRTDPPRGTKMKLVQRGGKLTGASVIGGAKGSKGNCGRKICQP